MRLLGIDGSGGNQDRSTASSAVIFPALLTITKTVLDNFGQPLFGPTPFTYTTTSPNLSGAGAELPPSFTLVHDGGVNAVTGLPNNQQQFKLYMFDTSSAQVTIKEQPVTGFVLGNLTCSATLNGVPQPGTYTVDLATGTVAIIPVEGEEINCTYVNQQALILTLIKQVINTNGGTALPQAFTLRVTGANTNIAKPGSATGTPYSVLPGTYTVSEVTPLVTGYNLVGFSGDCDASGTVVLQAGEAKTCTVTNADSPAHLTIRKVVVNTNGGTKRATDFSFIVNGGAATPFAQDGADVLRGLNTVDIPAGTFSVVEYATPVAGYTTTYSGGSGTILNGETKTCTITNTNTPAHLIINKVVVNDNGGALTAANFSGTVSGVTASNGQTWTGASTNLTLTTLGSYSVAENAHPGYDATFSADCTATIALGETKTCTVTNNDQAAHLIVTKVVVNDNGGTLTAASFSGTVSGVTTAAGNTWAGASTNLTLTKVGNYSVAENAHPGYGATFSTGCTGTIALGETRTCTVTNDDLPPRLTLIKHVVNDNGGTLTASAFTLTASGSAIPGGSRSVPGTEAPGVTIDLTTGSYIVTESSVSGYTQTGAVGCAGTVAIGGTVTCTFTNSDDKANPTVDSNMSWVLHDSLTGTYNDGAATLCGDEAHTITVYDPAALVAQFITPVNGATNVVISQPIEWTAVLDAQAYYLYIGSSPGAKDLVNSGELQSTTYQTSGLPAGQLLYARLWTRKGSVWRFVDSSFTMAP